MGEFVATEVAVAAEHFVALIALVGLVVGVREQVGLEIGPLIEAPHADGTLVRRLFHVQDLVDGQGTRLTESFATFLTLERFLLGVDVSERERERNGGH